MTQLSLFAPTGVQKNEKERPESGVLCVWRTEIEDRDENGQPLFYRIAVRCREAVVTRKIEGRKRTMPGYAVEVSSFLSAGPECPEEELTHYYKDFLQAEKKPAIREYSWCVAQVHHRWRVTAQSRIRCLREDRDPGDWYECPFCGYRCLEFFETCPGCGMRFMRPGR